MFSPGCWLYTDCVLDIQKVKDYLELTWVDDEEIRCKSRSVLLEYLSSVSSVDEDEEHGSLPDLFQA